MSAFNYQNLEFYRRLPSRLVIGVSGGRSSAYQMAHIVEAYGGIIPKDWVFSFQNTGLEREETLTFLHRLDDYFDLDLVWLEYDPFLPTKVKRVTYETAARQGEPMEALLSEVIPKRRDGTAGVRPLPNPVQRVCTSTLKIKTVHRYLRKHLDWPTQYHSVVGYRSDEPLRYRRAQKRNISGWPEGGRALAPMHLANVDEGKVIDFWYNAPFDLELDSDFGNCDLCFMASTWKIKRRILLLALEAQVRCRPGAAPPLRVQRWINWEERVSDRPGVFRKDRPNFRQLWEQVCDGNYDSAVPEGKEDRCRSCTD